MLDAISRRYRPMYISRGTKPSSASYPKQPRPASQVDRYTYRTPIVHHDHPSTRFLGPRPRPRLDVDADADAVAVAVVQPQLTSQRGGGRGLSLFSFSFSVLLSWRALHLHDSLLFSVLIFPASKQSSWASYRWTLNQILGKLGSV